MVPLEDSTFEPKNRADGDIFEVDSTNGGSGAQPSYKWKANLFLRANEKINQKQKPNHKQNSTGNMGLRATRKEYDSTNQRDQAGKYVHSPEQKHSKRLKVENWKYDSRYEQHTKETGRCVSKQEHTPTKETCRDDSKVEQHTRNTPLGPLASITLAVPSGCRRDIPDDFNGRNRP